jgi:hypothetical protein
MHSTLDRLAPGNMVIVPKFINRCLWDRFRNEVLQGADIGCLGIYGLFFAANIGRLGAKGLKDKKFEIEKPFFLKILWF